MGNICRSPMAGRRLDTGPCSLAVGTACRRHTGSVAKRKIWHTQVEVKSQAGVHAVVVINNETLRNLAAKYVWWKTPDDAVAMPHRVIAQVMNIGDYADVQTLAHEVGEPVLRDVLTHAQAGQFDERSWAYWHYRLGLAPSDSLPPIPVRRFP